MATCVGLESRIVEVEAHIAPGLPSFKIVGLPDKSVEEAKERVMATVKSSGYTFPLKRSTVNLATASSTVDACGLS
ncbi:MAG: magnesium chelatase domain-containing protein [Candidatus Dojkabacteria bacterium]|nr:magnesium chelatase domain-containing protein [Candidatus Dojkabacteria bacterium]